MHLLPAQQAVIIIQNPEDRIALNVQQHSLIQMGRAKLSHQLPAIKCFYKRAILLKRGDANTASKALLNERLF